MCLSVYLSMCVPLIIAPCRSGPMSPRAMPSGVLNSFYGHSWSKGIRRGPILSTTNRKETPTVEHADDNYNKS